MKFQNRIGSILLIALAVVLIGYSASRAHAPNEYRFKVTNKTENTIEKLLASEDGKKYGYFDIGEGIEPGESITIVWDKATDESNCEWSFKAVFDDGEESEPATFDFCEKQLELVFD